MQKSDKNNSEDEYWGEDIHVLDGNGLERRVGLWNVRLCESVTPNVGRMTNLQRRREGEGS